MTVVATPEPETVPRRKPEATTARPGAAGAGFLPNSAKAQSMIELAGAAAVEHRAIEREDDDEGRRHIHGRREQAFESEIVLPDDARDREAAMVEGLGHIAAEIAIDEKTDGDERQAPSRSRAASLRAPGGSARRRARSRCRAARWRASWWLRDECRDNRPRRKRARSGASR